MWGEGYTDRHPVARVESVRSAGRCFLTLTAKHLPEQNDILPILGTVSGFLLP
jgi:hypothetical protein